MNELKMNEDSFQKFINNNNTCYLNSAIQMLYNNSMFMSLINNCDVNNFKDIKFKLFFNEFLKLKTKEDTTFFKRMLGSYNSIFNTNEQQDTHETFINIIDIIHNGLNNKIKYEMIPDISYNNKSLNTYYNYFNKFGNSEIIDIFYGQYLFEITCSYCSFKSSSFQLFNSLEVPLKKDLNQSISSIMIDEIIPEFHCDKCNKKTNSNRKSFIWKFPKSLNIIIKRFDNYGIKDNTEIKFNDVITFNRQGTKLNYKLKTIVNHINNVNVTSGHYNIIISKDEQNHILINDEKIYNIKPNYSSSYAYIISYEIC